MKGWMGSLLEVDLESKSTKTIELSREVLLKYVGGRGLGVYYMNAKIDPKVNPLSKENPIIFATGPLTGTIAPSSSRCTAISKSPLTKTIFDSNAGGNFGNAIKQAGLDAIVVKGRSSRPVILIIDDGEVSIESGDGYWGMKTSETIKALKKDYGREFEIACIGPAGENGIYFANIRCSHENFFGRGGLGAVMGSKNLKAIIVRGNRKVEVHDQEELIKLMRKCIDRLKINPLTGKALPRFGTRFLTKIINNSNALPALNFKLRSWNKANELSGEVFRQYIISRSSCPGCPIACKNTTKINGVEVHGPEYESVWALGVNCGLSSLKHLAEAIRLCDELGLDTISMGGAIACLMEMSERGVIEEKIEWGSGEAIIKLIKCTVQRKGLGKLLSLGSARMAEKLGRKELSMTVKRLELPAYDPRELFGMALAYATSNRGGCHLRAYMTSMEVLGLPILIDKKTIIGKAELVAVNQNFLAIVDSLITCKFAALELDDEILSHILSSVTGIKFDRGMLMKIGERIWNLERMFNLKAGISPEEDTLPSRLLKEVPLKEMLEAYYQIRGWDRNGIPLKSKLEELQLLGEMTGIEG